MEKSIPSLKIQFEHIADNVYLLGPQTSTILWRKRNACTQIALSERNALRTTDFIYQWGEEESVDVSSMTFSMRIAYLPCYEADFDTLFNRADSAVYLAKKRGRNRTIFSIDAEKAIGPKTSTIDLIRD